MALFVEFHLIQNFAPSNLNRDDTGAPKDALFGGHRRARVSSQCFKRAIRVGEFPKLLRKENLSLRTKKLVQEVSDMLVQGGHDPDVAKRAITNAVTCMGTTKEKMKVGEDQKTDYLVLIGQNEIKALTAIVQDNLDTLGAEKPKIDKVLKASLEAALDGSGAIDLALFGRMLSNLPDRSPLAACQVSHAISTHKVERDFDYFTAIDDLAGPAEAKAAHLDSVEFNSATYYRYAVVDVDKLVSNLKQDSALAVIGLEALTKAIAMAIPTGKQNTFAAHNLPAFVGVALRETSPINLANAFEKPIWPEQNHPISTLSVKALAEYDDKVSAFYGNGQDAWAYLDLSGVWPAAKGGAKPNLEALASWVRDQVAARLEG